MQKSLLLIGLILAAVLIAACSASGVSVPAAPAAPAGEPIAPASEPVAAAPASEPAVAATAAPSTEPAALPAEYAGTYQASLPAADTAGRNLTLVLAEDGTLTLTTDYLNGEAPIVETGAWQGNADGTATLTLTDQGGRKYFQPVSVNAKLDGDTLSVTGAPMLYGSQGLALTKVTAEQAAAPTVAPAEPTAAPTEAPAAPATMDVTGTYTASLPVAGTSGVLVTVEIAASGAATVTGDYQNGEPPIVETGAWAPNPDGGIAITLTGNQYSEFDEPSVTNAMLDEAGNLSIPQSSGGVLTLTRAAGVEAAPPGPAATAVVTSTVEATATVTTTVEAAPAVTTTVEATPVVTTTTVATSTAAIPSAFSPENLENTYLALRPAASGGGTTLLALQLNDDGSATLSSDYTNGQPAIVEVGTWQDNGDETLTVTLTGQQDREYDKPVVVTFQRDDEYLTSVDAKDRFGEEGLRLRLAAAVARQARASLFTMDLEAGFPLDPTFVSVNGGGEVDASLLGGNCRGFINLQPVVKVNWSGKADLAKIFFVSDDDPTLVVMTPDGNVLCNDNANPQLLDPRVRIDNPPEGQYRIWVGSAHPGQLIPGVLVLTTKEDVSLATFNLGSFVKRPPLPEALPQPTPDPATAVITGTVATAKTTAPLFKAGEALEATVTADGTFPAFTVPALRDKGCAGLVSVMPQYTFQVAGPQESLSVFFEATEDTTLMVIGAGGQVVSCGDDAEAGKNINPVITLAEPPEGLYSVWVGRLDPAVPITGTLTVTDQPVQPATLAPAAQQ